MNSLQLQEHIIEKAQALGATQVETRHHSNIYKGYECRKGVTQNIEQSTANSLAIRVLIGNQQAKLSTTMLDLNSVDALVERAVEMAKFSTEDPYCQLVDKELMAKEQSAGNFNCYDETPVDMNNLKELAHACEESALLVDGITNSEGGSATYNVSNSSVMNSNGLLKQKQYTTVSYGTYVIAGSGSNMQGDYDSNSAIRLSDLKNPADIGKNAGERAVKRLNYKKIKTEQLPVIFDKRVARSLLSSLIGAINGRSIANKSSFLNLDKIGTALFNDKITIIDNPHLNNSVYSTLIDGEGLSTSLKKIVDQGVLKHILLDSYSARQLNMQPNGNSAVGPSPTVFNTYIENGNISLDDMIKGQNKAILITDLIGSGLNPITGDYSIGAGGFMIENGQITYPVSEFTIASNILEMYKTLTPASDLEMKLQSLNSPSLLIDQMTIAGN